MSVDVRMSADKVRTKQPELHDAMVNGLRWTVIKREAVKRWPMIPKLVQATRQVAGQICNGETHFELLANIQSLAKDMADGIDWGAVQDAASITESRYKHDIPYLCTLVQLYGGGVAGRHIHKLSNFATAALPDDRTVSSHVWESLARLKIEQKALSPFVIWSIVKAEALCHMKFGKKAAWSTPIIKGLQHLEEPRSPR